MNDGGKLFSPFVAAEILEKRSNGILNKGSDSNNRMVELLEQDKAGNSFHSINDRRDQTSVRQSMSLEEIIFMKLSLAFWAHGLGKKEVLESL